MEFNVKLPGLRLSFLMKFVCRYYFYDDKLCSKKKRKDFCDLRKLQCDGQNHCKFSGVSGELSTFSRLCHKSRKRTYIITETALNLRALRSTFYVRLMLYSLLAVFWFSTSSSIASLRFNGDEVFVFVTLNSSFSIFLCRCSEPSIVIAVTASWSSDGANASGLQLDCLIIDDLESQVDGEIHD